MLFFKRKQARTDRHGTDTLGVYDLRVGHYFTLKPNPLRREHPQDFVDCDLPGAPRRAN